MSANATRLIASFVLITNFFAISKLQAQAKVPALILTAVSEQQLGVLKGNTHPLARAEFDQGLAPSDLPMQRMLLVLKRSPDQDAALLKLLDDQQNPGSSNYHHWLTPEQFGAQFGLADSDIAQVTSWLESHGLTVNSVSNGRTVIEFSGTAASVEGAFHTAMHKYAVNNKEYWANASDPQIPAALMPAIAGIPSLNNFFSSPQVLLSDSKVTAQIQPGSAKPLFTTGGAHYLVPSDYAVIYNTNPLLSAGINGAGTVIGVVGRTNINAQDVVSFRSVFGLPANAPNIILNGPDPGNLRGNEEVEAVLDTSWSGAVAPGAKIDLVVSASTATTDGVTLSEQYIIDHNLANVMTESFGDCEANYTSSDAAEISTLAQQAAAQGITYMVATGDSGSADCATAGAASATGPISPNMIATTPYTIAVGGTQFNEGSSSAFWSSTNKNNMSSALSYVPEDVWNNNCDGALCNATGVVLATGGGRSAFFTKPSWQTGVPGIPNDGKRDIPDVSLTSAGHDAYLLCLGGSCSTGSSVSFTTVYGTSAAAPAFAGIMALVNQKTGVRQGQANTMLYRLAAAQNWANCNSSNTPNLPPTTCIFHDVTVGTNAVPGETGYNTSSQTYPATVGYDLATGLGSVNAAALLNAWSGAGGGTPFPTPPFSVSPTSGTGLTQQFTFTFSNAAGASKIAQSLMLFSSNGGASQACELTYKAANNGLYLTADNGTSLIGPVTPGGSGSLSNSQCSVAASSVSVLPSGNSLVIVETLSFNSTFVGSKQIMMSTVDTANVNSGWSSVGFWGVPPPPAPAFSVSPTSGSGTSQAFTFKFTSSAGASSIGQGHMLITGNGTGNQACYLLYQASNNALYLLSDDGQVLTGPVTPGGSGSLSNSQCSIAASSVTVTPVGNTLQITETASFTPSFAGSKNTMMFMFNTANVGTGWATVGTWTVPGTPPPPPPAAFNVSPASGSGATQAFTFTFTSSAGASSIWQGHMLITGNGTGNQACYLLYQASNNGLYLLSDNGQALIGPVTPGGSGTLSNSQCSVAASKVSVTSSGNSLKVTETTGFTSAFNGSKNTMMYMYNFANVGTGWGTVGTWTVP
ncbi:MAG TPA: S53 family peptidase [Bryobacteraceae bacterium]